MILTILAAALAVQAAPAPANVEMRCDAIVTRDGRTESVPMPALRVLEQTAADGPFITDVPAGAAIRCGRSDLVPAEHDWKVLAAGYPLFIVEVAASDDLRAGVLEMVEGRMQFRMLAGQLGEAEAARLQARLNASQHHLQR